LPYLQQVTKILLITLRRLRKKGKGSGVNDPTYELHIETEGAWHTVFGQRTLPIQDQLGVFT
jgi:hypothetical protein